MREARSGLPVDCSTIFTGTASAMPVLLVATSFSLGAFPGWICIGWSDGCSLESASWTDNSTLSVEMLFGTTISWLAFPGPSACKLPGRNRAVATPKLAMLQRTTVTAGLDFMSAPVDPGLTWARQESSQRESWQRGRY